MKWKNLLIYNLRQENLHSFSVLDGALKEKLDPNAHDLKIIHIDPKTEPEEFLGQLSIDRFRNVIFADSFMSKDLKKIEKSIKSCKRILEKENIKFISG